MSTRYSLRANVLIALATAAAFAVIVSSHTRGARGIPSPPPDPYSRALFLSPQAVIDTARLSANRRIADSTEVNTFVVQAKDSSGVWFDTSIGLFRRSRTPFIDTTYSLRSLVDSAHAWGIRVAVLITVGRDRGLPALRPKWAVQTDDGALWKADGVTWLSMWHEATCNVHIDLAEEAVRAGADEVIFKEMRLPLQRPDLPEQVHPARRADVPAYVPIYNCLQKVRKKIDKPVGVMVDERVVLSLEHNPGHGEVFEMLLLAADKVYVEAFPEEIGSPRAPETASRQVFEKTWSRVHVAERHPKTRAYLVPVLQAYTDESHPDYVYRTRHLRVQLRASYSVNFNNWVAFNPGGTYSRFDGAFERRQDSHVQLFNVTPERIRWAERAPRPDSILAQIDRSS